MLLKASGVFAFGDIRGLDSLIRLQVVWQQAASLGMGGLGSLQLAGFRASPHRFSWLDFVHVSGLHR